MLATTVCSVIVTTPLALSVATVPVNVLLFKINRPSRPLLTRIDEAPAKLTPAGSTSLITRFWAVPGPAFVMTMVYTNGSPALTGFGAPVLRICKSAMFGIGVGVNVAVLVGVAVGVAVLVGVGVNVFVGVGVLGGVAVINVVLAWAELFASITSFVTVTLAVFSSAGPVAFALTSALPRMVTTPPTFNVPTVPVNALLVKSKLLLMPLLTLIREVPSKLTPAGSTSLMTTFCATLGPAFVTTMV